MFNTPSGADMENATYHGAKYPPLETVTRSGLTTDECAYYLNRKPQTLRAWACREDGPLRARRIHGRLDWPTSDTRKLCGVE